MANALTQHITNTTPHNICSGNPIYSMQTYIRPHDVGERRSNPGSLTQSELWLLCHAPRAGCLSFLPLCRPPIDSVATPRSAVDAVDCYVVIWDAFSVENTIWSLKYGNISNNLISIQADVRFLCELLLGSDLDAWWLMAINWPVVCRCRWAIISCVPCPVDTDDWNSIFASDWHCDESRYGRLESVPIVY